MAYCFECREAATATGLGLRDGLTVVAAVAAIDAAIATTAFVTNLQ